MVVNMENVGYRRNCFVHGTLNGRHAVFYVDGFGQGIVIAQTILSFEDAVVLSVMLNRECTKLSGDARCMG